MEYSKKENYEVNFIDWKKYPNFKEQLKIMNNCDIHISGAGTSMLNFPFLNDNSVHINLGVKHFSESHLHRPSLMETNICLLSNNIYCEFYNIYKHKEILYKETKILLERNIHNLKNKIYLKSLLPDYIKKWQSLCKKHPEKTHELILHLCGEKEPSLIYYRFPDIVIYEYLDIYRNFLKKCNYAFLL